MTSNIPTGTTYSVYDGNIEKITPKQNFINNGTLQIGVYFTHGEVDNYGQFQNFGNINLGPALTVAGYSKFYNEGHLNMHDSNKKGVNTMLYISHDGQFYQKSGGSAYVVGSHNNGWLGGVQNYGLMDFASTAGDFILGKQVDYEKGTFGELTNGGTITLDSKMIIANDSEVINNGSFTIGNNGSLVATGVDSGVLENTGSGYIVNKGKLESKNPNLLINNGTIDSTFGSFDWHNTRGSGKFIGPTEYSGKLSPGNSAGGLYFDGDLTLQAGAVKVIELSGDSDFGRDRINSEHDFIDVTGDLIINGGELNVSLIDGFELSLDQEFIIAKIDGELTGTFDGLEQGASVGKFDSIFGEMEMNLFINYAAGDGNDIALSTSQIF